MEVLNPIYGTSFKYLMEDDMSAKIPLPALPRKKVETLIPRRRETCPSAASDYSAHLITADGREEDVCVEKVWPPTS